MTSTSILLMFVGIFVLLNASNFVKVFKGEAKLSFIGGNTATSSGQGAGTTGTSGNNVNSESSASVNLGN